MLYNLVERAKYGNKQVNRVELPFDLDCYCWENTSQLAKDGKISKEIAEQYKYITNYNPIDWTIEELNITSPGQYLLSN